MLNAQKAPSAIALISLLLLAGCGGGGEGDSGGPGGGPETPDPVETGPARVEGVWTGTALHLGSASTRPAVLIATRQGDTLLFVQRGADSVVVRGDACCDNLVQGDGDGWTLVNQRRTVAPVNLIITDLITGERALTGPVTVEGERYDLDMRLSSDYAQPLSFANVANSYTLTTQSGVRATFSISPTGALAGTDVVGCSFSSHLSIPDATRNLFVLSSLTMSGCTGGAAVRNGSYSGLGFIGGLSDPAAPKVLNFILTGNLVYPLALPGGLAAPPMVTLTTTSATTEYGGSVVLNWTAPEGAQCNAGGAWSGGKAPGKGSEQTAALTQDSTFALICSLNGVSQTASASVAVSPLPPDPGAAGQTFLAGVDANLNGVRDDVERLVLTSFPPGPVRTSLLKRAEILGDALEATTGQDASVAFTRMFQSLECLYSLDASRAAAMSAELLASVANTSARANAYFDFAALSGGTVVETRDPEQSNASCAE